MNKVIDGILHSVIKYHVHRACFHRDREASANFGGKVEYKEERKKKERIEHLQ